MTFLFTGLSLVTSYNENLTMAHIQFHTFKNPVKILKLMLRVLILMFLCYQCLKVLQLTKSQMK